MSLDFIRRARALFQVCCSFALLLSFAAGARAAATNDAAIWRPRFATPAIVALDTAAAREFTVEVKASSSARDWSATIANDLKTWNCRVVWAKYATINRDTEPGWQVRLSVPASASPELFALTISSSEGAGTQPQSVSVVSAFATNFYILHISDEQIVNQIHTDPSGQYFKMVGTWEEIKWMQQPVNLINPRFVIVTGDQIDFNGALDGWNNWSNWGYQPKGKKTFTEKETVELENRLSELYRDCHKGYRVAYVETPGNHDVAPSGKCLYGSTIDWHPVSARIYESQFGQRSWSFRMGDFYVLMHDWSDAGLKDWAEDDYARARHAGVRYRVIGQHFNVSWNGAPNGTAPVNPPSCDLMLIGHGHTVKTIQTSPYYVYEDGPAFWYGTTGFFNFRRAPDGWTCDQTVSPRNAENDVWPLFTAHGTTAKVRCDQPDAMNISANSVTITNDLPQNFYDGRVRFVLERGVYSRIINGNLLAQYDCPNGKTALVVKVNIPSRGTITVTVPDGVF